MRGIRGARQVEESSVSAMEEAVAGPCQALTAGDGAGQGELRRAIFERVDDLDAGLPARAVERVDDLDAGLPARAVGRVG